MHRIKNITLYNFKNYQQTDIQTDANIVCIVGKNGTGKTTILDAIYFLCYTKSYFTHIDQHCIRNGESEMMIQMNIQDALQEDTIKAIIRQQGKKEIAINNEWLSKLTQHIGKYTAVMIAPDDIQIITEGSEWRRKFIDGIISQINPTYFQALQQNQKTLQQRNAYLKMCKNQPPDLTYIQLLNEQLIATAQIIVDQRVLYVAALRSHAQELYTALSNDAEKVTIEYQSKLRMHDYQQLLHESMHKDLIIGRTSEGIHKDDLIFTLSDMPMKQTASQGQRKTFLFSLKLAQFNLVQQNLGIAPILLLDDIFEKLDHQRSQTLIKKIAGLNTQIFITDTHQERIITYMKDYTPLLISTDNMT